MSQLFFVKVSSQKLIKIVVQIADKIWRQHYPPIIGLCQVEYMLDKFQSSAAIAAQVRKGFEYFLIEQQAGNYIGYIAIFARGQEMFLSKIYIDIAYRSRGYGREAISFITRLARDKGCFRITLAVNKNNINAINFYKKCGFLKIGSTIQDIGAGFIMDDYRMEKIV
jgi:ribosomal protein S18 acetylase RimI-like enzyme